MGKFDCITNDYDKLMKYKYDFHLNDGTIINLVFHKRNLPHLLGFQYYDEVHPLFRDLNDEKKVKVKSTNIFKKLKEKNITYESLSNSLSDYQKNRIEKFTYDNVTSLLRENNTFSFIYDSTRTKNSKAKYVFIEEKSTFLHFYIGYDVKGYYYPNSFSPSDKKEENIDDKPIKITKTVVTYLPTNKVEVIEHDCIMKLTESMIGNIDNFNENNTKMYQELKKDNPNEISAETLKKSAEAYFRLVIQDYDNLKSLTNTENLFSKYDYAKIRNFIRLYIKHFNVTKSEIS